MRNGKPCCGELNSHIYSSYNDEAFALLNAVDVNIDDKSEMPSLLTEVAPLYLALPMDNSALNIQHLTQILPLSHPNFVIKLLK